MGFARLLGNSKTERKFDLDEMWTFSKLMRSAPVLNNELGLLRKSTREKLLKKVCTFVEYSDDVNRRVELTTKGNDATCCINLCFVKLHFPELRRMWIVLHV